MKTIKLTKNNIIAACLLSISLVIFSIYITNSFSNKLEYLEKVLIDKSIQLQADQFQSVISEDRLKSCIDGSITSNSRCALWIPEIKPGPKWLSKKATATILNNNVIANTTWSEVSNSNIEIWSYVNNGVFSVVYVDYIKKNPNF